MSTPQPPELSGSPILWDVEYLDGSMAHALDGSWNGLVGTPEQHDGQTLFCARKPVKAIQVLLPDGDPLILHVEGLPCFAQARFAQALGVPAHPDAPTPPIWLATAFGYLLPDLAIVLIVTGSGAHLFALPRPFSLPW